MIGIWRGREWSNNTVQWIPTKHDGYTEPPIRVIAGSSGVEVHGRVVLRSLSEVMAFGDAMEQATRMATQLAEQHRGSWDPTPPE